MLGFRHLSYDRRSLALMRNRSSAFGIALSGFVPTRYRRDRSVRLLWATQNKFTGKALKNARKQI